MIVSRMIQDIKKRPFAFIAMISLVILGTQLGLWQLRRAEVKIQLSAEINRKASLPILSANAQLWSLEQTEYYRMQATGYWLPKQAIWLANRPHPLGKDPKTGIATGFNLLMPLKLDTPLETILWVNRGWAPRSFDQINRVPEIITEQDKVKIEGIVFPDSGKTYQLAPEVENRASDGLKIQENLNLKDDAIFGEKLLPFVLRDQTALTSDGLDKSLPAFKSGVNTHYGYAFQWFGLAVMTFLYWIFTSFRKRT